MGWHWFIPQINQNSFKAISSWSHNQPYGNKHTKTYTRKIKTCKQNLLTRFYKLSQKENDLGLKNQIVTMLMQSPSLAREDS